MALYDVSGTTVGSTTLAESTEAVLYVSGAVYGSSVLTDGLTADLSESLLGSGVVTGNAMLIQAISGSIQGSSALDLSLPNPLIGTSNLSAFAEVVCIWPPVCQTCPTQSFDWGHVFGHCDLTFCFTDLHGAPWDPVCVNYTLYQLQPGCALKQVGPSGRKPVRWRNGCYYATGTAGECGQPGLWAIRWAYRGTFSDPLVEKVCYFAVLDAVLCPVPGDTLQRFCKYGWD